MKELFFTYLSTFNLFKLNLVWCLLVLVLASFVNWTRLIGILVNWSNILWLISKKTKNELCSRKWFLFPWLIWISFNQIWVNIYQDFSLAPITRWTGFSSFINLIEVLKVDKIWNMNTVEKWRPAFLYLSFRVIWFRFITVLIWFPLQFEASARIKFNLNSRSEFKK